MPIAVGGIALGAVALGAWALGPLLDPAEAAVEAGADGDGPAGDAEGTDEAAADGSFPVPTPYGTVRVHTEERDGSRWVDASCACSLPAEVLGVALDEVPIHATGTLDGAHFVGEVRVREVTLQVDATVDASSLASGTFRLPSTPLSDAYAALGEAIPESDTVEMRGTISAEGDFQLQPRLVHVQPRVDGFAVDGLVSADYRVGPFTFRGRDEDKQPIAVRSGEGTPNWLSLHELGPTLPMAVIGAEDAGFLRHAGYDLAGMLEAAKANEAEGAIVRGGSTISQQLGKNLFLTPDRTYVRKLREILYAVEMERELGKERILELYLNIVEWGPTLRGAKQASEAYFLKQPAGLLPEEAAFLASILRNPRGGWEKQYRDGHVETRRLKWILDNMRGLSEQERAAALSRDVHFVPQKE